MPIACLRNNSCELASLKESVDRIPCTSEMHLYSGVSVGGLFAANAYCSIGYYVALTYHIKNLTPNFTRLHQHEY